MPGQVLVIGATGSVGSELVTQLGRKGEKVRAAATREPAARRSPDNAVEFVEFDLERPETFVSTLAGADRVFLIARPGDDHADRVAFQLIDEMKRQGVRHVVNLSAMGVETLNDFALRKVERYLEESGIGFTHLRPNFFMQVFSTGPLLLDIRSTGGIHIPAADAKLSYINHRRSRAKRSRVGRSFARSGGTADWFLSAGPAGVLRAGFVRCSGGSR